MPTILHIPSERHHVLFGFLISLKHCEEKIYLNCAGGKLHANGGLGL